MRFNLNDLPDLNQKVVIITGGTAGLGLSSAIMLASKNAQVIITARSEERGKQAIEEIKRACDKEVNVSYGIMEQKDLKSVKAFSEWFLSKQLPLHVLLLNAGVAAVPCEMIEGIESQFYIDHLAHFYLAKLLLKKIEESAPSRIVFVASDAHTTFTKEKPNWKELATSTYEGVSAAFKRYGYAKLANIQTAISLSRLVKDKQVWVNSIHPGAVATNIATKHPLSKTFFGKALVNTLNFFFKSPDNGALTQVYVCAHPDIELKDYRGCYFVPTAQLQSPNRLALDEKSQEELWQLSEDLIKEIMKS